jgi:hypothetical protein
MNSSTRTLHFTCQMANTSETHATSLLKLQGITRVAIHHASIVHNGHTVIVHTCRQLGSRFFWPLESGLLRARSPAPTLSRASARPSSSSVHDHRRRKSSAQVFDINLQRSYASTSIAAIRKLESFGS